MRLYELMSGIEGVRVVSGSPEVEIAGISSNSKAIEAGYLFVAIRGTSADGHEFISDAIAKGAVAVVVEDVPDDLPEHVACIVASDTRRVYALMAARFYGNPSRFMRVVAITGTNGKTTITYVLEAIAKHIHKRAGVIGTTGYRFDSHTEDAPNTTPDAVKLQSLLAEMKDAGVEFVFAEFSSHALHQRRVDGTDITGALFTNLSRDHLDYHESFEDYLKAKLRLFTEILVDSSGMNKFAAVCIDSDAGKSVFEETLKTGIPTFSTSTHNEQADFYCSHISYSIEGTSAILHHDGTEFELHTNLIGEYNLSNVLLAIAAAFGLGISIQDSLDAIAKGIQVPGRMERIQTDTDLTVIVDYAHTDDGLQKVLSAIRPLAKQRLIVVMGAGGDRDKSKRDPMGFTAANLADVVVITSDNPRTEDPLAIIEQIVQGAMRAGAKRLESFIDAASTNGFVVEPDRHKAILGAILDVARDGDVVVIAGKGHEDYQILGTKKIHFDDREEASAALKIRKEK